MFLNSSISHEKIIKFYLPKQSRTNERTDTWTGKNVAMHMRLFFVNAPSARKVVNSSSSLMKSVRESQKAARGKIDGLMKALEGKGKPLVKGLKEGAEAGELRTE